MLREQQKAKSEMALLRKQEQATLHAEKQSRADSVRSLAKNKREFSFRNEGSGGGGGGGGGGGRTALGSFEPKNTHLQFYAQQRALKATVISVAVPENAPPGSIITTEAPSGEIISIPVPANAKVNE